MKNTSYLLSTVLFLTSALLIGCQPVGVPVTSVTITTPSSSFTTFEPVAKPKKPPRFRYRGQYKRDPFVSLLDEGSSSSKDEIIIPRISSLELKGVLQDSNSKIALLSAGGHSYFLKNSRLYDSRQRAIRGLKGKIRKESVYMRSSDGTRKEIFLRQKVN